MIDNAPESGKDFLTNCFMREGLFPFLRKMEEDNRATRKPFSLLVMDVDHFKTFNDKYGHLSGDEVLKYFSSSLRLDLEDEENVPFRFGGDEFIVVFPRKSASEAYRLAARLQKNIKSRSCLIKGRQLKITFSGGIASYPHDARSAEDLLDKADKALYYSKNHGRGRTTKYSEMQAMQLFRILLGIAVVLAGVVSLFVLEPIAKPILHYPIDLINRVYIRIGVKRSSETEIPDKLPPPRTNHVELSTPAPVTAEPPTSVAGSDSSPETVQNPEPNLTNAADVSVIYLSSGKILRAAILEQGDDEILVEPELLRGKGTLRIKRSQIDRIENAPTTI